MRATGRVPPTLFAALAALPALVTLGSNLWLGRAWDASRTEPGGTTLAGDRDSASGALPTEAWRQLGATFLPAVVDGIWLRAMLDPSQSDASRTGHPPRFHAFMALTELDPAFLDAYFAGANLLAIVHNDGRGALELLERGEEFRTGALVEPLSTLRERTWRSPWVVPLLLAYVHLFELDDLESASWAFANAAAVPGAPPYLQSLSARLAKPGGKLEVGLRILNFNLTTAPSEEVRERLLQRRDSLYLLQYLFDLNRELEAFGRRMGPEPRSPRDRERLWRRFRAETGTPERDPWNGKLFLGPDLKIDSTTPRVPVFGLIR